MENMPFPSLPYASVSKRVFLQNLSTENEIDLHENDPSRETHFHMNGFGTKTRFDTEPKAS